MYIIVNKANSILRINNVPLFGNKIALLACFYTEDDALKTLYECEKNGLIGHHVANTGDAFFIEPDLSGENMAKVGSFCKT